MPSKLKFIFVKLNKRDIAYFQFILEGYEGLVTATTINKKDAVVKLFIMPSFYDDVKMILRELRKEIAFDEIDYFESR